MAKAKTKDQAVMLDKVITLPAPEFVQRLKKLTPFMSTDVTRYCLCGVFMSYSAGKLTLVATNGHILQEQVFSIADSGAPDFSVICPAFAIKSLPKLLSAPKPYANDADDDEDESHARYDIFFTLKVEDKKIRFIFSDWEFVVNAIDGKYPDYHKVIPVNAPRKSYGLDINYAMDAAEALGRVAMDVFAASETAPHLFVNPADDSIRCVVMPMRNVLTCWN